MLEKVRFDTLYSFIYSTRPHTQAQKWLEIDRSVELIDEEIAKDRLMRLKDRHKEILTEDNMKQLGRVHKILFESFDETHSMLEGRSDTNKLVRVKAERNLIGEICEVKISQIKGAQLLGELIS